MPSWISSSQRTCDECEIRRSDIIVEHALHSPNPWWYER